MSGSLLCSHLGLEQTVFCSLLLQHAAVCLVEGKGSINIEMGYVLSLYTLRKLKACHRSEIFLYAGGVFITSIPFVLVLPSGGASITELHTNVSLRHNQEK